MSGGSPLLAWYGAAELDQVPEAMAYLTPATRRSVTLTFRDGVGGWWRPRADGHWLRHRDGRWEEGARPERLEGCTPLPVPLELTADPDAVLGPIGEGLDEDGPPPEQLDLAAGLARSVWLAVEWYRRGWLRSTTAELVLTRSILITTEGHPCTVGPCTMRWYRYDDGWSTVDDPPTGPFATGEAIRSVLDTADAARRWVEVGPLLPEPITPDWEPPPPPGPGV